MKKHLIILTTAALSAISTLAVAQTPAPSTPPSGTMAPVSMSSGGLQMANTAPVAVKFATVKSTDIMSSKLIGTNVYNNQNESVGEVEDLVIDNGKTITGVVVSVGGFLGMGESYVVLDPSTVAIHQKDGKWTASVDTSKDNLKNAPKFTYSKNKS